MTCGSQLMYQISSHLRSAFTGTSDRIHIYDPAVTMENHRRPHTSYGFPSVMNVIFITPKLTLFVLPAAIHGSGNADPAVIVVIFGASRMDLVKKIQRTSSRKSCSTIQHQFITTGVSVSKNFPFLFLPCLFFTFIVDAVVSYKQPTSVLFSEDVCSTLFSLVTVYDVYTYRIGGSQKM
ncbi:hypothetical protein RB195_004175 [Necator americanus]|uniref:7TM GPCR serpentine receptor class x (Srx) domain-containing protein n=1 Tax=Necator americanus TaxID=51031 RepID=A0ABR1BGZ2_NECAM